MVFLNLHVKVYLHLLQPFLKCAAAWLPYQTTALGQNVVLTVLFD